MTEDEGKNLLRACFTEAGYAIEPDFHFREGDVEVDLDGWDPSARVGYEYITESAGDHLQFDARTLDAFERRIAKGELFVLLVDEHDAVTADALRAGANAFLAEVRKQRGAR